MSDFTTPWMPATIIDNDVPTSIFYIDCSESMVKESRALLKEEVRKDLQNDRLQSIFAQEISYEHKHWRPFWEYDLGEERTYAPEWQTNEFGILGFIYKYWTVGIRVFTASLN